MGKLIQPKKTASIKILLVDHDTENRTSLKAELEKKYDVMTADDGVEAQLMLECNNDFDMIVSNQSMPVMSGLNLFSWVKSEHPHTPKILLVQSNEYTEEVKSRSQDHEFFCLDKSLSQDKLVEAIGLAVIGVKPITNDSLHIVNNNTEELPPSGCKMAVLDTNTKNWPIYNKLTKDSDLINEVVYYRNPQLLLERVKKDASLGVICISFNAHNNEVNDVIEKINWLKNHPKVILMCGIKQVKTALQYQSKGIIFQHIVNPFPVAKLLQEIECAATEFHCTDAETADSNKQKTAAQVVDHLMKRPESHYSQALI